METIIQKLFEYQNNQIYLKREDLIPFCFGGNKARKAILFFEEIDRGDYDCVVTYGSSSSNLCRVVANMAAARKMPCYIISPQESSEPTFNSVLMEIFHVRMKTVPVKEVSVTIQNTIEKLREQGATPYFIAGGGHGNLGTKAYVECYSEIRNYEKREHIYFESVFHASGTGTTQAGLVCGKLLNHDDRKIIGISIARRNPYGKTVVEESVRQYLKNENCQVSDEKIHESTVFVDDYIGGGYGTADESVNALIWKMMYEYGIPMDQTYVGKAFYGMLRYIEKEHISDKNILFLHTGGTPLFFDSIRKAETERAK